MSTLIELRDVTKTYGGGLLHRSPTTAALHRFSLSVDEDDHAITALAGESGSGKTTLARLLMGFISPTTGAVLYRGKDLRFMTRTERMQFRRDVQPVFQDPFEVFNPFYRVDHVLWTPVKRFGLADSTRAGRQLIDESLEMVGLRPQDTLGRFPHQLSGGQRQRIMVARALLLRPKVIVADEPVSMVDASMRATILETLRTLNIQLGIALVYITHDLATAYQICDNVIVLYRGAVAEAGSVERVIRDPQHPYTRLLISSTPLPDPTRRWGEDVVELGDRDEPPINQGCRFATRCPHAMPRCWQALPPLYRLHADRAAACYLHDNAETLAGDDLTDLFQHDPSRAH